MCEKKHLLQFEAFIHSLDFSREVVVGTEIPEGGGGGTGGGVGGKGGTIPNSTLSPPE